MTHLSEEQARSALLLAANRAALYGTLARWLMHDLRGPVQAISLVTDLLEQGDTVDEPSVRASIQEASGRLRQLVDLLDQVLRRPETNGEVGPIVLREPITRAVELLRLQRTKVALDAGPALTVRLPAVRGVYDDVLHALLNILLNAYEALAPTGGGTVRVTAELAGDRVRIVVSDTGPGVGVDAERLFEPFVTTKPGQLAGLGLWAARELLRRSDGTVRYEPRPGGATFVLELPVWTPA
jgi:signal transduction histidine kinase